jgi:hypothetical protein
MMLAKVIQVSFSDDDFKYLQKMAQEEGITVPMYVKKKVLPRREYDEAFERLLQLISELQPGEEFSIREVFGTQWKTISKGTRLSLGRCFYQSLEKGLVQGVVALDKKDASHSQMYKKVR